MMKKAYWMVMVVALATPLALAQMGAPSTSPSGSAQPEMGGPTKPVGPADQSTAGTPAPASQTPVATVDDATLNRQIQQQLSSDPNLKSVQASVQNGVVDLSGTVPSKDDRKKAKKLVGAIPGVKKVHEHLTIGASAGSTGGSNEPAEAKGGSATPSSSSPAAAASAGKTSETANNTAGSIAGNSGAASSTPQAGASASTAPTTGATHGMISGSGTQTASTGAAAATTGNGSAKDVEKAINSQVAGAHVQVNEKSKNLVLTGSVPVDSDRQMAEQIAATVAGPKTIIDQLTTTSAGGASASAGASAAPSTQAQSPAAGTTSASGSQTATATTGTPSATDATAGQTMAGTAPTPGAMTGQPAATTGGTMTGQAGAATPAAAGSAGAGSSDAVLQSQIQNALKSEPTLATARVNVSVNADTVDVAGNVSSGKERQSALRIAQSYAGNRRVVDHLVMPGMQGANAAPGTAMPAAAAPSSNATPGAAGANPGSAAPAPTGTNPSTPAGGVNSPATTPPNTPRQ